MGRIRSGAVKRIGEKLIKASPAFFNIKFEDNKKKVMEKAEVQTKKFRNLIAGYITKKLKTTKT